MRFIFILLVSTISFSQSKTPEQIVQENLDFYNQKDIEGFSSLLSSNIKLYEFGRVKPKSVGLYGVKKLYKKLFENSPNLKSTLINRIIIGNMVIDKEHIVGRNGVKEALELVVIYEVTNQKISKLTVIRN